MRAVNERRVIVEYARVHRLVSEGELLPQDAEFGVNIARLLISARGYTVWWWNRIWRLGNIEFKVRSGEVVLRPDSDPLTRVLDMRRSWQSISGLFGWVEEESEAELAPRYDEQHRRWITEPTMRAGGAVGLFLLDGESQVMAITNYSGTDLSIRGFCHAMTNLLNDAERDRRSRAEVTASVEWLVEPLVEKGTFAEWLATVGEVRRVHADFHLPNPSPKPILEPAYQLLEDLHASKATVAAESARPGGLQPEGHPLMRAALAMQEEAYGDVRATGVEQSGQISAYNSREYRARDIEEQPEDLSLSGLTAILLKWLLARVERRSEKRGDR